MSGCISNYAPTRSSVDFSRPESIAPLVQVWEITLARNQAKDYTHFQKLLDLYCQEVIPSLGLETFHNVCAAWAEQRWVEAEERLRTLGKLYPSSNMGNYFTLLQGDVAVQRSEYGQARKLYRDVLESSLTHQQFVGMPRDYWTARTMFGLGRAQRESPGNEIQDLQEAMDRLHGAGHLFESLFGSAQEGGTWERHYALLCAYARCRLAQALKDLGQLKEALGDLKVSRLLAVEHPLLRAIIASEIADVQRHLGKLGEAWKYGQEALKYFQSVDSRSEDMVKSVRRPAMVLRSQEWFPEAEEVMIQALRLAILQRYWKEVGINLHELGIILRQQGRLSDAERCYRLSHWIFSEDPVTQTEAIPSTYDQALDYDLWGLVEFERGHFHIALAAHRKARSLLGATDLENLGSLPYQFRLAQFLLNEGRAAIHTWKSDEAQAALEESGKLFEKLGDVAHHSETLLQRAMLAQNQGDWAEGERLIQSAQKEVENALLGGVEDAHEKRILESQVEECKECLADIAISQGKSPAADSEPQEPETRSEGEGKQYEEYEAISEWLRKIVGPLPSSRRDKEELMGGLFNEIAKGVSQQYGLGDASAWRSITLVQALADSNQDEGEGEKQ